MSEITLSRGVRSNLLQLQRAAEMIGSTQSKLATGKRVNSALDNPTNFFTSSSLNARAGDLGNLLDSMSNGIKTLEAADNGLKAITKTVESMQATVRQARQDRSWRGLSFTVDKASIGTVATKTISFSGGSVGTTPVAINLNTADVGGSQSTRTTSADYAAPAAAAKASTIDGTVDLSSGLAGDKTFTVAAGGKTVTFTLADNKNTTQDAADALNAARGDLTGLIEFKVDGNKLDIQALGNFDGKIVTGGANEDAVFGAADASSATAGSDGKFSFSVNGTAITLDTTTGANLNTAIETINKALGSTSTVQAVADGNKLQFKATSNGAVAIDITGDDSGLFGTTTTGTAPTTAGTVRTTDELVTAINGNSSLAGKVRAVNDNGSLRIENLSTESLTITGFTGATGGATGGTGTRTIEGNEVRKNLISQFNEQRRQLDQLADDAGYNGANLLRGDALAIDFNESGTSNITIQAKNSAGQVRAINTSTLAIGEGDAEEFSADAELDTRLDGLATALTTLRSQASAFGANLSTVQNRQDFTKSMINTLKSGADNLVLADMNEEAANLLALQTRQQLSSTALSFASQADQSVLRLF